MDNSHLTEWKNIKGYYKYMIDNNYTKETTKEQYQFRIECIESLIEGEKEKELAHFR